MSEPVAQQQKSVRSTVGIVGEGANAVMQELMLLFGGQVPVGPPEVLVSFTQVRYPIATGTNLIVMTEEQYNAMLDAGIPFDTHSFEAPDPRGAAQLAVEMFVANDCEAEILDVNIPELDKHMIFVECQQVSRILAFHSPGLEIVEHLKATGVIPPDPQ